MTREAELELEIARLREALGIISFSAYDSVATVAKNALSTPPSTAALQDLITEVERRTIERCAEYLDETDSQYYDGYEFRTLLPSELGECLRALPTGNLKLEDLK